MDGSDCIHHLFERQAERAPQAAALDDDGERLTYAELNARASQLARRLRAAGVAAEALVGLLAERSAQMVVARLAVLKAGGACGPVDPGHPGRRVGCPG